MQKEKISEEISRLTGVLEDKGEVADWQTAKAYGLVGAARSVLEMDAAYAGLRRRLGYCIIAWAFVSLLLLRFTMAFGELANFFFSCLWFALVTFLYVFQDTIAQLMIRNKKQWLVRRFFLPKAE